MIVLGIDPGTAALGYGIVERTGARLRLVDAGCLETPSSWALPQRLLAIHSHVVEQIELHRPDIVAVERLFFSKNAQTAFAVGQARGVVLLAAAGGALTLLHSAYNSGSIKDYLPRQDRFGLDLTWGFGSAHPGGMNMAMCDGSVRYVSATIRPETLRALFTKAAGEPTSDF